jgi:hypothetical protein
LLSSNAAAAFGRSSSKPCNSCNSHQFTYRDNYIWTLLWMSNHTLISGIHFSLLLELTIVKFFPMCQFGALSEPLA